MEINAFTSDSYQAPEGNSEALHKEKGSKFYAYCFHTPTLEDVSTYIEELKKKHHSARHFCYAYRINPRENLVRFNDDGEPKNSAGLPIFNQILSHNLWDCLVVVVRYFGGTKLGVSGLVNAYKIAAEESLIQLKKEDKYLSKSLRIQFEYPLMDKVMRIVNSEKILILSQDLRLNANFELSIRESEYNQLYTLFTDLYGVNIIKD